MMRQCQGCRTAYLDPRPSAETLPLAYRRYYTHDAPLLKKTISVHGLKWLRRALANEAPNIDAIGHKVFGRHWRGLEAPRHLVLFNWGTAEQLLSETGFVDMTRHPRHEVFGDMWRKSALIQVGMNPENGSVSNAPQPRLRIRLQSRFDWRRSEFVTVTARKPR